MRKRTAGLLIGSLLFVSPWLYAQEGKPSFSGTWKFNKERSDLRKPAFRQMDPGLMGARPGMGGGMGGPGMGGPGMGGPGMGGGGMGGPPAGGPGMGGPGTGGPGMGGPGGRGDWGTGDPEMMGIVETLVINHEDPNLTVKVPMKFGENEQVLEFHHTTDGKANRNDLPGGATVKAKTRWSKNRLVTKSTSEGPMGSMEVIEARSLSGDGRTMTVEFTMRAGPMDWERKLVYEKVVPPESVK